MSTDPSFISVIIPTFNRAELLGRSLESLVAQSLPPDRFEVVVIDDGSTDDTAGVCRDYASRLPLVYQRQANSGISAAKNMGVFRAQGPLLLFFDDDDVADAELLAEHVRSHTQYPQEHIAVLGYTAWHPALAVSRVMEFVTDIGQFLFSYGNLKDGQTLDYTYFWGGRSSCKRSLLVRHGVFNQRFRFGSEDIELGYRLSKHGLMVIYNARAKSYMIRPLTYDQFCQRCIKQGRSQYHFSRMHPDPAIQRYCLVEDAEAKWAFVRQKLEEKMQRARELEGLLEDAPRAHQKAMLNELGKLYWWTFTALKIKGVVEERAADTEQAPRRAPDVPPLGASDLAALQGRWDTFLPRPFVRGEVLIVDPLLPMYDRASGSLRLFEIIKALIRMGYRITYIARDGDQAEHYVPVLQRMGVEVYAGDPSALQEFNLDTIAPYLDVEKILTTKAFDYVILSFWHIAEHYLPLVRRHCPAAHVIVDTVDIHFLREFREAEMKKDAGLLETARRNKTRELAVYQQADRLWVVTDDDRRVIADLVRAPIDVVPNIHKRIPWDKAYERSANLLFVGNFNHKPNVDAVLFLHHKIWPLIHKRLPEVKLYIAGNNPPAEIKKMASSCCIVTGYVSDLTPYLREARISINPLTYGAGMKGKVGEALSCGLPVVTTSIGAEGMGLVDGQTAMIADDPCDFADKVVELYHDRALWERLAREGKRLVEQRWSPDAIQKRIEASFLDARRFRPGQVSLVLELPARAQGAEEVNGLQAAFEAPVETVVIAHAPDEMAARRLLQLGEADGPRHVRTLIEVPGADAIRAWNRAMSQCTGETLILCRPDGAVDPTVLEALLDLAARQPAIDVLTPARPRISWRQGHPDGPRPALRALRCLMLRPTALKALGGFDADLGDPAAAWYDYLARATRIGLRMAHLEETPGAPPAAGFQELTHGLWRAFSAKWGLPDGAGPELDIPAVVAHGLDLPIATFCSLGAPDPEGRPAVRKRIRPRPHPDAPPALTSIIILCFNALAYTRQCLESIALFTPEPHEIIIVDNASTDGTGAFLKDYARCNAHVTVITNPVNTGYAAGNNQGIKQARGTYVVLLNNDVIVTEGWLGRLIGHLEDHPENGMVGPVTNAISGAQLIPDVPYGNDLQHMHRFAGEMHVQQEGIVEPSMRLIGFCLLIRKAVLEIIGGLDEGYRTGNFEDDDLCLRTLLAGYRNLIARDVFVHHFGSMSFKANAIDYGATMSANRDYFIAKWPGIVQGHADGSLSVHIEPSQRAAYLLRWGEEAFQAGDVLRALRIFERVLHIEPANTEVLNNLGVIQWELGRQADAIATFQAVLRVRPDDGDALDNLAAALAGGVDTAIDPAIRALLDQRQSTPPRDEGNENA